MIGIELVSFLGNQSNPYGGPIPSAIAKMNFLTEEFEFNGSSVSASTVLSGYDSGETTPGVGTAIREGSTNWPIASAGLLAAINAQLATGVTIIVELGSNDNVGGALFYTFSDADPDNSAYSLYMDVPQVDVPDNPKIYLTDGGDVDLEVDLVSEAAIDPDGVIRAAATIGRVGEGGFEYAIGVNGAYVEQDDQTTVDDQLARHDGELKLLAFGGLEQWNLVWETAYIRKVEIYPALNNATTQMKSGEGIPLTVETSAVPDQEGSTFVPYTTFNVVGLGGQSPYTYSVLSGTLPPGVTLNSSTGAVSGTPTTVGAYSDIVLRATDYLGNTADLPAFDIQVNSFGFLLKSAGSTGLGVGETETVLFSDFIPGDASRKVVVFLSMAGISSVDREFTGVDIDGIAGKLIGQISYDTYERAAYLVDYPGSEETANLTITATDGPEVSIGVAYYNLYGLGADTVEPYFANDTQATDLSVTIDLPVDSVVMASSFAFHTQGNTWTNLTERSHHDHSVWDIFQETAANAFATAQELTVTAHNQPTSLLAVMLSDTVLDDDFFSDVGSTSAWYPATQDNARYYSDIDKTIITYEMWDGGTGRKGAITEYDHATSKWSYNYPMTNPNINDDDHGVPMIVRDHEGYFHSFGFRHDDSVEIMSSAYPNKIYPMLPRTAITSVDWTYVHPHLVGSQLFLFGRQNIDASTKKTLQLITSATLSAGVATWNSAITLVDFEADSRVYQGYHYHDSTANEIWIPVSRASWNDTYRRDVYLFIYNTSTGAIRNYANTVSVATGSQPILRSTADTSFRLVNFGTDEGNLIAMDRDGNGVMHIVYPRGPDENGSTIYHRSSADNFAAENNTGLKTTYRYSHANLTIHADNTLEVWAGRTIATPGAADGNMYRALSNDAGLTWHGNGLVKAKRVGGENIGRPVRVKNAHADLRTIFAEQGPAANSYGINRRLYAYGANGFVRRSDPASVIDRMSVAPSSAQQALIEETIADLQAAGLWDKLDLFYALRSHNQQAARLNWKNPGYELIENNSPTFTAYSGFNGNGSNSWLDTGFCVSRIQTQVANGSVGAGVYVETNSTNANGVCGLGSGATGSAGGILIVPRTAGNTASFRANATASTTVGSTDSRGHWTVTRGDGGSTACKFYRNGSEIGTATSTAPSRMNASWALCKNGTGYNSFVLSFAYLGSMLTATEIATMGTILENYRTNYVA